jgi:hypothetical protein
MIRQAPADPSNGSATNLAMFTIEEVTEPAELARARAQHERTERNLEWLQAHWADLLPQARGKFLVVAGQQAFVADTPEEAWNRAEAAHPEDDGAFIRYVRPHKGPRIYADCRQMAPG